jgi:hypothetical protein
VLAVSRILSSETVGAKKDFASLLPAVSGSDSREAQRHGSRQSVFAGKSMFEAAEALTRWTPAAGATNDCV